ncbi:MAG: TetR/AcrR family transcriptional regulator [Candidatus Aminicenantes bacterium]|nr:TetR/AcrR family transcriptional regulator [Candidatus Aminicenantes bacterium]
MESELSYHKTNLREKIITEAAKIISEKGIDSLSMRKLSQTLHISRTAAYHYFKNKDQLLQSVAETGFQKLRNSLISIKEDPHLSTIDIFKEIGKKYIYFALEETEFFRLMFTISVKRYFHFSEDSAILKNFEFSSEPAFALFQDFFTYIQLGKDSNFFQSTDPLLVANTLFAFIHGLAILAINNQLKLTTSLDEFLEQSFDLFFSGICSAKK